MLFSDFTLPRVKPFVEFCWREGVISFFKIPGISININDETKFIYNVCCMMDGTKSFKILKHDLFLSYPKESQFFESLLTALDNEYLIEDVGFSSTDKNERWSKNIEFMGAYTQFNDSKFEKQKKLNETKVVILGLGGVGSNVLLNLAALGVVNFKIVDFDLITKSNLNRQILYKESDIGKRKTDVAKSKILDIFPSANIEHINMKIQSEEDIEELIDGQDFVFGAADVPREKILDWINTICVRLRVPYICGGLDSLWATYFSVIPGKSGCMECWKESAKLNNKSLYQEVIQENYYHAASSSNVAIMPMISIVVGLMTNEFLKIITEIALPQALGKLCVFNFLSAEISTQESWEKKSGCKVCSIN